MDSFKVQEILKDSIKKFGDKLASKADHGLVDLDDALEILGDAMIEAFNARDNMLVEENDQEALDEIVTATGKMFLGGKLIPNQPRVVTAGEKKIRDALRAKEAKEKAEVMKVMTEEKERALAEMMKAIDEINLLKKDIEPQKVGVTVKYDDPASWLDENAKAAILDSLNKETRRRLK